MNKKANEEQKQKGTEKQCAVQRIYIKDFSFEAPKTPKLFQQEWKPEMQIEIDSEHDNFLDNHFEVVLTVTVDVKSNSNSAFLVEVKQAGIFDIEGLNDIELEHCLGSYCPTILYPYAREAISDIVSKASFPQLILAPVNFDAVFMQRKQQEAQQKATKGKDDKK